MGFPLALLSSVAEKSRHSRLPRLRRHGERGRMAHGPFERFFVFPKLRTKNSVENSERKTKRQRSKLLDSPNSARMAREGSAGNRGVLLPLDVSRSASRRLASISV